MNENYLETFREESGELLDKLEKICLEIDPEKAAPGTVQDIFRCLHTIKGNSSMFGFDEISVFVHRLESLYEEIRDHRRKLSMEIINLTLQAADCIRENIVSALETGASEPVPCAGRDRILGQLDALANTDARAVAQAGKEIASGIPVEDVEALAIYRIRFTPPGDIFLRGIDPQAMLRELASLGDCKIIARTEQVPVFTELEPELCYISWDVLISTNRGMNAIKDIFIFVEDQSTIKIDLVDTVSPDRETSMEPRYKLLGEILLERGDITETDLAQVLKSHKKIGEALVDAKIVDQPAVASALAEQEYVKERKRSIGSELILPTIRVKAERVDELVNLVGELVTLQARLQTVALSDGGGELRFVAEESERLIQQLRESAMSMRMLSLEFLFSKLKRLVHDLSRDLGKEIEFLVEGAETELDKSVIERLGDPLIHIFRNSIDHGIEPGETRIKNGKPPVGRIRIKAYHAEANVFLEVSDDGAGLDREAIFARAVKNNLMASDSHLSDEEIFSFIFMPGFSTAASVSSVSGRGVGMDVVKQTIESLGGRVHVTSVRGSGTTVIMKIPLTLSIIEGLFVRIESDVYVIPLSLVEECVELPESGNDGDNRQHLLPIRGELLPYIKLRDFFNIHSASPRFQKVVVVRGERRIGLTVDDVIGNAQVVIKTLGPVFGKTDGILGATVTGDGKVSLILDVGRIAARAIAEETSRVRK